MSVTLCYYIQKTKHIHQTADNCKKTRGRSFIVPTNEYSLWNIPKSKSDVKISSNQRYRSKNIGQPE
jgi:hypothetical protein